MVTATSPSKRKKLALHHHRHRPSPPLLPDLPDHVAQFCLSHLLPSLLFSVCRSWRRLIYSSSFPPFFSIYALLSSSPNSLDFFNFDPISSKWNPLPNHPPLDLLIHHPSLLSRNLPVQSLAVSGHLLAATTQPFHNQTPPGMVTAVPQPPQVRPRVRARRGQATDPHSIAERLRRERIAERMKALQELVPSCNKTDRAAMLDEIVDYVKFLRLQVKVLSMSRLGGAGAVAQLVADVPLSSVEGEGIESGNNQQAWEKWSSDGTEQQVAKLMEEDVGAAMQFLQSKALCIMPISLASAIFRTHQADPPIIVKPEMNTP